MNIEKIWPVVVPSYKRGSNAKTLKMLSSNPDPRLPLYLFIYKDDADNYKEIIESGTFNVVYCEGFRGIVPKRNFINEKMLELGYDNIFVLDDDIPELFITHAGVQKKDPSKYRSVKDLATPYEFFSKFEEEILSAKNHLSQTGCLFEIGAAFYDIRTKPIVRDDVRFPIQLVHMNIKDLADHNIKYRTDHGWDDFDLTMQILDAGLMTGDVTNMTYSTEKMEPSKSVANVGDLKWTKISLLSYKTWGDLFKFSEKEGQVNAKPNRHRILNKLKDGKKLSESVTYEDEYREIVENNDFQKLQDMFVSNETNQSSLERNDGKYDCLIVGAGLFGSVCAHELAKQGKKVLVVDKNPFIGGSCATENINGINVHKFGPHIFHTSNKTIWDYVNQFAEFNRFINMPVARFHDEIYNLPFNMNTFSKLWNDVFTPEDAKNKIAEEIRNSGITDISNLEEKAISMVGTTIYEKLIKEYTEKQWGMDCKDLPADIIKRLPLRFNYDNNYYNSLYQGIPNGGYTAMFEKMLKHKNIEVRLNCDYLNERDSLNEIADKIIFTGQIDKYFDYQFGHLEYRSLRFETQTLNVSNYQGNAVVNYTSKDVPYTRITEHKHFEFGNSLCKNPLDDSFTVISKEYSEVYEDGKNDPYYPINNTKNNEMYAKYADLAKSNDKVVFGGRLGLYKYFDMDKIIEEAIELTKKI